jgi:hypothetical protein
MRILFLISTIFGLSFSIEKCPEVKESYKLLITDTNGFFIEYMQTNNEIKKDTGNILFETNNTYILHRKYKEKIFIQKENVYYLKYYR